MEQFKVIVSGFLALPQVRLLMGLVLADLLFGVLSALKRQVFDYRRVFDFYVTNFLPYLGGYAVAHILAALADPDLLGPYGAVIVWLLDNSWGVVVAKIMTSIIANIGELGYKIPAIEEG